MAGELILIVEDNDKNRKLVRDVLTFKGYTTIEAETGEAGVRLAQERRPNLVLMGIHWHVRRCGPRHTACRNRTAGEQNPAGRILGTRRPDREPALRRRPPARVARTRVRGRPGHYHRRALG